MIKVGKILGIMEIFLIFFDFWVGIFFGDFGFWGAARSTRSTRILGEMVGTGAWWGLASASFSECSECSECSDDKKVWGVGVGIFCWWFGYFL